MSEIKNKKTKKEDNKIEVKIPRLVWWTSLLFFVGALSLAFISAIDATKEWIGLSSICLALSAAAIAYWRMDLIHKQNELTNKNIEIQQQVGHRQNYFDSIKYLESESPTLRKGAIQELVGQLETDEKRRLQIIHTLSSSLHKNTIQENDTETERRDKIAIIQATLDALACRKPEWLPPGFELDIRDITFNKNAKRILLTIKNLKGAKLQNANFQNTDIHLANLERANLWRADFKQAVCDEIDFKEANLCSADLSQAEDITQKQINLAFGDAATKLPPDLRMPPHWPSIELKRWHADSEWKYWKDNKKNLAPRRKQTK